MRPLLILFPVLLFSTPALAAGCTADFLGGKPPAVTSSKLTVDVQLCFDGIHGGLFVGQPGDVVAANHDVV